MNELYAESHQVHKTHTSTVNTGVSQGNVEMVDSSESVDDSISEEKGPAGEEAAIAVQCASQNSNTPSSELSSICNDLNISHDFTC